jgi:hypothetical protein
MPKPERNKPCPCGSGRKFKKCCGASGPRIESIETGGATVRGVTITIPRERLHIKVNPEALLNQLRAEHPAFAESFDRAFGEELKRISSAHARSMALTAACFKEFSGEATRAQQLMAVLLLNASETLMASVTVLRAAAVEQYDRGQISSARTITRAKQVLPFFGRMYGFFSREFAHLGRLHAQLPIPGRYEPGDEGARLNLAFIRMVVVLFSMVAELAFFTFVGDPKYWKRMGGRQVAFDPGPAMSDDIEFILGGDPDIKL